MKPLPAKITPDAISEALVEIRFEYGDLPEVIFGKLISADQWTSCAKVRLPSAEIPEQLRAMDPNLRYIPSLEVRLTPTEVVRVGSNVISHHNVGTYLGWSELRPRMLKTTTTLFDAVPHAQLTRLGLRYINVLTREHHVQSVFDLNLTIEVAGKRPSSEVQLAYQLEPGSDLQGMLRVITPSFAQGSVPPASVALIDVDIYTDLPTGVSKVSDVEAWLDRAHNAEKSAFFNLLTDESIHKLQEGIACSSHQA